MIGLKSTTALAVLLGLATAAALPSPIEAAETLQRSSCVLGQYGSDTNETKARFDNIDKNGDGMISRQEYMDCCLTINEQTSTQDRKKPAEVSALTDEAFAKFDRNKDGQISRDEALGGSQKKG